MSKVLFWAAVAISLITFSASSFAQAAVEGALTHGLSSSAGSSLGSALGRAMNGAAGRVGQQVSNTAPRPVTTRPRLGLQNRGQANPSLPGVPTPSSSGSLITSIQGAAPGTTVCPAEPAGKQAKPGAPGSQQTENCVVKAANQPITHPSEITLPAPQ